MNFNTILLRFGTDPDCFINEDRDPIRTDNGFIYEVRQRTDIRICPRCASSNAYIHDHDTVEINCSETDQIKDILRIIKTRFRCKDCGSTYTMPINGIERYSKTSDQTLRLITGDFTKMISFASIGRRYGLSTQRIIQIFDERTPYIPRLRLPEVLCMDEISFDGDNDAPYCCVLYDHNKREIIDIIKNRQLDYLKEYFSSIDERERNNVRYFVSDMYDGYRYICRHYLKKALHIIDLFHVVQLLTRAVNKIRYDHVKNIKDPDHTGRFMKNNWKLFLCRSENIPDKWYTPKGYGDSIHYSDMVFEGVKRYPDLLCAYNILQDLYHYSRNDTFTESLVFIDSISERLMISGTEILEDTGRSYRKWRIEIADGLARNQSGKHYSNGIAESINNNLKTIIKTAYGYRNFERFRKRAIIISRYKKI